MLGLWDMFDDLMRMDPWFTPSFWGLEGASFQPPVDIVEHDDAYLLEAELPGLGLEDVEVELEGNVLTISGERRDEEDKEDNGAFRRIERRYGSFTRTFTVPVNVKADQIDAEMTNGVLAVRLPKAEQARRQIAVKPSATRLAEGEKTVEAHTTSKIEAAAMG